MKMKIAEVAESVAALAELSQVPLSGLVAYRVSKITRALAAASGAYDEARNKLLETCGKPVEGRPGQFAIVDPERWQREMKELDAEEVEIPPHPKFQVADFAEAKVKPAVFTTLHWCIDEAAAPK